MKTDLLILMAEIMQRTTGDKCVVKKRRYASCSKNSRQYWALVRTDPTDKEFVTFYYGTVGAR